MLSCSRLPREGSRRYIIHSVAFHVVRTVFHVHLDTYILHNASLSWLFCLRFCKTWAFSLPCFMEPLFLLDGFSIFRAMFSSDLLLLLWSCSWPTCLRFLDICWTLTFPPDPHIIVALVSHDRQVVDMCCVDSDPHHFLVYYFFSEVMDFYRSVSPSFCLFLRWFVWSLAQHALFFVGPK